MNKVKMISFITIVLTIFMIFILPGKVDAISLERFTYQQIGTNLKVFVKLFPSEIPTNCKFESIRPNVNQNINIIVPQTNSPNIAYCYGQISLRSDTALNEPTAKVIATNPRGGTFEITNPVKYSGEPIINIIKLNGSNNNTISVDPNSNVNVEAVISDMIGNLSCNISKVNGNAEIHNVVNSFGSCTFLVKTLGENSSFNIYSTNAFGVNSAVVNFTVNVVQPQLPQPPSPSITPSNPPILSNNSNQSVQQANIEDFQPTIGLEVNLPQDQNTNEQDINFTKLFSLTEGEVILTDELKNSDKTLNYLNLPSTLFLVSFLLATTGVILLILKIFKIIKLNKFLLFIYGFTTISVPLLTVWHTDSLIRDSQILDTQIAFFTNDKKQVAENIGSLDLARYGIDPNLKNFDQLSNTKQYNLDVRVAQTPSGNVWAKQGELDPNKNFTLLFKLSEFNEPKAIVQISQYPLTPLNCKKDIIHNEQIEIIKVADNESIFSFNFSNVIPKNILNGNYTGKVKYYLRVADPQSDCNNNFYSNNVEISLVSEKTVENFVPEAKDIKLVTSGLAPKQLGEISNLTDKIFVGKDSKSAELYFYIDNLPVNQFPKYGRWQVALTKFNDNSCFNTDNIIAVQDVDLQHNPSPVFKIDTSIFENKAETIKNFQDINNNFAISINKLFNPDLAQKLDNKIKFLSKEIIDVENKPLEFFIRFIALNQTDGGCDATFKPSSQVSVKYGKSDIQPVKVYTHEYHEVKINSDLELLSIEYQPVKFQSEWFNPIGHYVYVEDVTYLDHDGTTNYLARKGDKFYISSEYTTSNESFLDKVNKAVNSIPEFVKAIVKIINYVANTYNSLKNIAVNTLAGGLNALGVPCNAECKMMLSAGLSIAQSAIGLPPSLPNFDQLMNQGIDYLAAELAEQVGENLGVPMADTLTEELTKKALNKLKDEISKSSEEIVKKSGFSFKPDPDYLYKPGVLKVKVKNTGKEVSGGYLKVNFIDKNFINDVDLKVRNAYKPISVNIPSIRPNEILEIPIFLEENYFDYRSYKFDTPSEYICNTQDGNCNITVANENYALEMRKSRWLKIFDSEVEFNLVLSGRNKLVNFDPKTLGFDINNWEKQNNNFGSLVWFDKTNGVYHHFIPNGIEKESIQQKVVLSKFSNNLKK